MENKKKVLLYRSWHRGCKETDLLLGSFAQKNIHFFNEEELSEYEKVVEMDDVELYRLLTAGIDSANPKIINKIIQFNIIDKTMHLVVTPD